MQKINSKWLKDFNIRKDIIKLLGENIGKTFCDINSTNVFLCQSPKAIQIRMKINQSDIIKITKPQSSRQCASGTKTDIQTNVTE